MVSPLPCSGVMIYLVCSNCPLIIPGRRFIACQEELSSRSFFRRHPSDKEVTNRSNYQVYLPSIRQAPCVINRVSRARSTLHSSSRSLGPYCSTLDTGVVGRTSNNGCTVFLFPFAFLRLTIDTPCISELMIRILSRWSSDASV